MAIRMFGNVGLLLASMVAKGYCTIEQFDRPPHGWPVLQANVAARGEAPPDWENQCRQWITTHPGDWAALQALHREQREAWLGGSTSRPGPRYPVVRRGEANQATAAPTAAAAVVDHELQGFAADDEDLMGFEPEGESWAA